MQIDFGPQNERTYHIGAVAIRKDGARVSSFNIPTKTPTPPAHAEARLLRKVDKGAVVYVARRLKDGRLACAKPCKHCEQALRNKKVSAVYFTGEDGQWYRLF